MAKWCWLKWGDSYSFSVLSGNNNNKILLIVPLVALESELGKWLAGKSKFQSFTIQTEFVWNRKEDSFPIPLTRFSILYLTSLPQGITAFKGRIFAKWLSYCFQLCLETSLLGSGGLGVAYLIRYIKLDYLGFIKYLCFRYLFGVGVSLGVWPRPIWWWYKSWNNKWWASPQTHCNTYEDISSLFSVGCSGDWSWGC